MDEQKSPPKPAAAAAARAIEGAKMSMTLAAARERGQKKNWAKVKEAFITDLKPEASIQEDFIARLKASRSRQCATPPPSPPSQDRRAASDDRVPAAL